MLDELQRQAVQASPDLKTAALHFAQARVQRQAVSPQHGLQGNLYVPVKDHPLTYLATLGCMGMGIPYFVLLYPMHYMGDLTAPGFDYGTAFLLSAGLMNLLLVLDAWDVASGRKD